MALAAPLRGSVRCPPTFLAPCLSRHTLHGSPARAGGSGAQRQAHTSTTSASTKRRIPDPIPFCPDPTTFLTLIGRSMSQHASKFESWEVLFGSSSAQLKDMGVEPARNRRYLLWWRDQFRRGRFGIGGDLQHVDESGAGEVRIRREANGARIAVNVPAAGNVPRISDEVLAAGVPIKGVKVQGPGQGVITGSHLVSVKGTENLAAKLAVAEGIWEVKRGHKVFGGERRRKNVLSKIAARARGTLT